MSVSDRVYDDNPRTRQPSPWPIALAIISGALLLTAVVCFAFPNG